MDVLGDGGTAGGFNHQLVPLRDSSCTQLMLGRRRTLQVSSGLNYLISSSNASALFLKMLYSVCSCSIALELDQRKQQETNFRFPTFLFIYIYTHIQ